MHGLYDIIYSFIELVHNVFEFSISAIEVAEIFILDYSIRQT